MIIVFLWPLWALGQMPVAAPTWGQKIEVASSGGINIEVRPWRGCSATRWDYVDDPSAAINDAGFVAVAWADQQSRDVYLHMYAPDGRLLFKQPVNISNNGSTFSWLPKMIITSTDPIRVYVLWQEIIDNGGTHCGDILFARSLDGGQTFETPLNLSNDAAGSGKGRVNRNGWSNGSLDLVLGPEGNLYATWTEYEGTLWFSRSTDQGATFSAPKPIANTGDAKPARDPALATDAQGTIYLAWAEGDNPTGDIQFTKSTDQGQTFSKPIIAYHDSDYSDAPSLLVDSHGTLHLIYNELSIRPQGCLVNGLLHYLRSADGGQTFVKVNSISDPEKDFFIPKNMGMDGRGTVYVVWYIWDRGCTGEEKPRGMGFSYSTDGGQTFASPSVVPDSDDLTLNIGFEGWSGGQRIAVNKTGAIAVVFGTFKKDVDSHIWLIRGQAAQK
ncbi:exo-alpha-sialidase [Candidatus Acetothermia bacterium]|nr:exo-alpha-sialidase [Candidatus Acetothermia bacterium]